jgi:AraC-like DNA-binding protein
MPWNTAMRASEFVESYMEAWNEGDPEGVADHLSADGVYRDIPMNQQSSPDELIINLNQFFSKHRHRYELIGEILQNGDSIAFQYRMCPFGNSEPCGPEQTYRGAEFVTLNGNSAATITDYYDTPDQVQEHKYAKSGLSDEHLIRYKTRLDRIMRSQQAFLKPDLTLPRLAEIVDCSVNHLSQVINSGFGMSFFDYLNRYRIEHATNLLTEQNSQSSAILNIAFTVGFNSNSAFYAAFKKFVGQTPAQYRRDQLQKDQ